MGIGSSTLKIYKDLHQEGIFDSVKTIMEFGSQEIFCEGDEWSVKDLFESFGVKDVPQEKIERISRRGSAREVYETLGFEYNCIDIDGMFGALTIDLNFEGVPEAHRNRYDFVTNFGTTEHLLNQYNCFKVMHDLTKPGGYMMHLLPCSGFINHGLFNYHPKMFWYLGKSNYYDYLAMWFGADTKNPEKFPRDTLSNFRHIDPETLDEFVSHTGGLTVLFRKAYDMEFIPPLDGEISGLSEKQQSRYWTLIDYPEMYHQMSPLKYQILSPDKKEQFYPNETGKEPETLQTQLYQVQSEKEKLEVCLRQCEEEISAMKTSKFWQLRNQWFNLKKLLGLPIE